MVAKATQVVKLRETSEDVVRASLQDYFGRAPFTSVRLTGSARPAGPRGAAAAAIGRRYEADADLVFTTVTKPNALHLRYDKALQHSNPVRPKSTSAASASRASSARGQAPRRAQQQQLRAASAKPASSAKRARA